MHFPFVYNDYIQTENAIEEGIKSKKLRQCKVFYTSVMSFKCAIECDEIELKGLYTRVLVPIQLYVPSRRKWPAQVCSFIHLKYLKIPFDFINFKMVRNALC